MTKRFVITGRVQGVGFRDFTQTIARQGAISGEVWNRIDGAVEGIASHVDEAALLEFEGRLALGPGRIDSISTVVVEGVYEPGPFRIGVTRA